MEQYGNASTFNLEPVLLQNIQASEYWRCTAAPLESVQAVIDQIYYDVTDVEPWMSGGARGASSAFVLLYRLCTLRPTEAQVRTLLAHPDSPYIRAIGFLCLRYTANPRTLWGWCDRFVADAEEFSPSPSGVGRPVSMGAYVRDLLLTHAYFETLFPRVPKPVADEIAAKLSARGLPPRAAGNAGQGGADRRGDAGAARPASVKASLSVAFGQRAPNRAGGREEGRGAWARADGSRDRRDDRGGWRDDRGRDHGYGDRGGYGGDRDRGRDRPRSRSPPRYRARSRSRSPPPPRR